MTMIRIAVAGAAGRMGRTLIAALGETSDMKLTAALERAGHSDLGQDAGTLAGSALANVAVSDNAKAALANTNAILDFTTPVASVALVELAGAAGAGLVISIT